MSWHEFTLTGQAGAILSIFDTYVVNNSYWSVYDANVGTNEKTYRNYDSANNVDYYVCIRDNYSDNARIELWEGWDLGSHSGTGSSLIYSSSTYYIVIWRESDDSGGWAVSVKDHRVIICDFVNGNAFYIGQLNRFDTTKNMPIVIAQSSEAESNHNPLGTGYNTSYSSCWKALFDDKGNVGAILQPESGSVNDEAYSKTSSGEALIFETPVYSTSSDLAIGTLDGAMSCHGADTQFVKGDIAQVNLVEWVFLKNAYGGSWVEKV